MKDKVQAVEAVFAALDEEISRFQSRTSLHCPSGCGKCCFKADIEATILEFIPFAHYLYQEGIAMTWLERLQNEESSICMILNPTQSGAGLCSEYPHRGLICRLFGYSARTNKYSERELVTCQIIKTGQAEAFGRAVESVKAGEDIPVMSAYYMQLHAIDFELTRDFFPINVAIRKALETVLQYYAYRE